MATGATLRPPGAGGTPPLPQKGPRRGGGGGGCGWTCTPRAAAPPAVCFRGGRGRPASPHQRAGAARGPSLGAAHGSAPEQYGGRAPHDPPMTNAHSGRAEGGFRSEGVSGGAVHWPPLIPPRPGAAPRPRPHAHAGGECADDKRGARVGNHGPPPRGGAGRPRRDPPTPPPNGPQAAGASAPTPRGRGDGPPFPRPREEPERGPPPRPSCLLPQEPRRTSEPAPARQDAAQIAPSEGGRARTGVVWGATPPMDRTTPVIPVWCLPMEGRGTERGKATPRPTGPPGHTNGGHGARAAPPPPSPPPGTRTPRTCPTGGAQPQDRWGDGPPPPPRHAAPTGLAGQGDSVGPPHPHTRAHSTWVADPNSPPSGRAVGGGGAPDPRRPSQQWKVPPPGTPFCHLHNPKPSRGEPGPDRPPPKHARQSKGPGQDTRRGTDHVERLYQRPVPGPHEVRTPQHPGGGERTPRERERTHTQRARGDYQKGQPDRAHGTHRPRGMAYQRARVRDTRTRRPARRSAGYAGRDGGNGRDTTPGTGPSPPNRPRAPRTHGRGTAPAKAVVAHCARPQPLG